LPDPRFQPDCTIEVDGRRVAARAGESVAVALLAAGRVLVARSAKYHRPRGAFCLAGSCHACLARVDGVPNRRTCRTPCHEGLSVTTQNALPTARSDVLGAIDHLFGRGLDHHHLATWNAAANRAAVAFSRRLAGLGRLPDQPPAPSPPAAVEHADALVVGAGPAGLGAAEALARAGRGVLLVEAEPVVGGRLRARLALPDDPPPGWAEASAGAVRGAGGDVACATTALGTWRDGTRLVVALLVAGDPPRLRLVRPDRLVLATGSSALPPLFPRNDRPGVYAARGLLCALAESGAVPGERAVVLGRGPEAAATADRLGAAGMEVARVEEVAEALGGRRLSGVVLPGGRRVACDTLAFAGPRAPASDLARTAGAEVALDAESGGFAVRAGVAGETSVPGVWVAGEVTGAMSAAEALGAGRRAGEGSR
jgi:sarcosine oxidase subunit alpha